MAAHGMRPHISNRARAKESETSWLFQSPTSTSPSSRGEDNLRDDSSATAWILIIDGKETKEYSTVIKTETEPEWKNNSTHGPIGWNVPSGITDENISRFGIRMQSHEGATETSDNWNINSVQVTYPDSGGGNAVLVDQAGGPLVRLTGSEPAWETVLT